MHYAIKWFQPVTRPPVISSDFGLEPARSPSTPFLIRLHPARNTAQASGEDRCWRYPRLTIYPSSLSTRLFCPSHPPTTSSHRPHRHGLRAALPGCGHALCYSPVFRLQKSLRQNPNIDVRKYSISPIAPPLSLAPKFPSLRLSTSHIASHACRVTDQLRPARSPTHTQDASIQEETPSQTHRSRRLIRPRPSKFLPVTSVGQEAQGGYNHIPLVMRSTIDVAI